MILPNKAPVISVIMPCFNAERHLQASVNSVLEQTYSEFELLIVNDGSTDNSLSILQSFYDPRIKIIKQENQGVCAARNAAISIACGNFIAFLDSDDTWHKDCLRELHQALLSNPDAVLAYCGWQNVGLPDPRGRPYVPENYETEQKLTQLFENCRWPIHACLTKSSAILAINGFDKRFKTSEDYLMWLKIAKDKPIVLVPKVLAYYHHHDGLQATQHKSRLAINHLLAQRSFLNDYPEDAKKIPLKLQKKLMYEPLLRRGFECYWARELDHARQIFRVVMKAGYGPLTLWRYMLPALLPYKMHCNLIKILSEK